MEPLGTLRQSEKEGCWTGCRHGGHCQPLAWQGEGGGGCRGKRNYRCSPCRSASWGTDPSGEGRREHGVFGGANGDYIAQSPWFRVVSAGHDSRLQVVSRPVHCVSYPLDQQACQVVVFSWLQHACGKISPTKHPPFKFVVVSCLLTSCWPEQVTKVKSKSKVKEQETIFLEQRQHEKGCK